MIITSHSNNDSGHHTKYGINVKNGNLHSYITIGSRSVVRIFIERTVKFCKQRLLTNKKRGNQLENLKANMFEGEVVQTSAPTIITVQAGTIAGPTKTSPW